jgi:hypothetical protein
MSKKVESQKAILRHARRIAKKARVNGRGRSHGLE